MRPTGTTTRFFIALGAMAIGQIALAQEQQTPQQQLRAIRTKLAQDVQPKLQSDDPLTVAWAAHTVAEFRLTDCIDDLRQQLRTTGKAEPYVALALLDALIQTEAKIPGEELQPFVTGLTQNSALVLALPNARRNLPLLLEAYRHCGRGNDVHRRCGDELAKTKAPGFTFELLREELFVVLWIWDQGEAATADRHGLGVATGCLRLRPPDGFPPSMEYGLTRSSRGRSNWLACRGCDLMSEEMIMTRTRWMEQLLGKRYGTATFDLMPRINIEWAGLEALRAREQDERTRLHEMHRALVAECLEAQLITAEEAKTLTPTLRVFWMDARNDQKEVILDSFGH